MPTDGHPFILWLMAGMIPWFFFADGLGNATTSILSYSYLVKKVVFRVSVIPIIKIASALFIHCFFVVLLFIMLYIHGYPPSLYQLQVFYYLFAALVLLIGSSWITSSIVVFVRDVGQIVSVLLQIGFWLTPIFWNYRVAPDGVKFLLRLNPAFYIVEGYREALLYNIWFWEDPWRAFYFWVSAILLFVAGAVIFLKLRPHFADVL
jgi:ABC-type polysaccharide/polyol phosphate export permease